MGRSPITPLAAPTESTVAKVERIEKLRSARRVAEHLGMHPKTSHRALPGHGIALKFIRAKGRGIPISSRFEEAAMTVQKKSLEKTEKPRPLVVRTWDL